MLEQSLAQMLFLVVVSPLSSAAMVCCWPPEWDRHARRWVSLQAGLGLLLAVLLLVLPAGAQSLVRAPAPVEVADLSHVAEPVAEEGSGPVVESGATSWRVEANRGWWRWGDAGSGRVVAAAWRCGLDGTTGWPLVSIAAVTWLAVIWRGGPFAPQRIESPLLVQSGSRRIELVLPLVCQGGANALLLLQDAITAWTLGGLWIVCMGLSAACLDQTDQRGLQDRKSVVIGGLNWQLTAWVLVGAVWVWRMAGSVWRTAEEGPQQVLSQIAVLTLAAETSGGFEPLSESWVTSSPQLASLMIIMLGVWWGLVPLHGWAWRLLSSGPVLASAMLVVMWWNLGAVLLARWVWPLGTADADLTWLMVALGIGGALYLALLALAQHELRKFVAALVLSQLQLAWAGLLAAPTADRPASWLLLQGVSTAGGLAIVAASRLALPSPLLATLNPSGLNPAAFNVGLPVNFKAGPLECLALRQPRCSLLLGLSLTALTAWPLGWHAVGWWAAWQNWFHLGPSLLLWAAVATAVLSVWGVIWNLERQLFSTEQSPLSSLLQSVIAPGLPVGQEHIAGTQADDLSGWQCAALAPLLLTLIIPSLAPGWAMVGMPGHAAGSSVAVSDTQQERRVTALTVTPPTVTPPRSLSNTDAVGHQSTPAVVENINPLNSESRSLTPW